MIDFITTATENFFQHQIGTTCNISDCQTQSRTIIAYIDIKSSSNTIHRVYITMDEPLLKQITELFLGEETPDEQTLLDMLLETTNMIVGSAKVLAEDSGSGFTIETPFIEGIEPFSIECDEKRTLEIENKMMIIAMKEL